MPYPTKIATCSYCSVRTLLKPTARDGHELACGSCGAPLHEMKWLKKPEAAKSSKAKRDSYAMPAPVFANANAKRRKTRKRGKSLLYKVIEEAWDIIEDVFD